MTRRIIGVWVSWLLGWSGSTLGQAGEKPGGSSLAPLPADIQKLVDELGAASYEARLNATRQLCRLGPAALEPLRAAQRNESFEIAGRAQQIVRLLERHYFGGVEVRLRASKSRVAWDEPFDLVLEMRNPSAHEARVPFAVGPRSTDRQVVSAPPAGDDADLDQVRGMIDAAEYLEVVDATGEAVDLRIDDLAESPAIAQLVRARAQAGPVEVLRPGQQITVTLTAFNRGWARFPLLSAGEATIRFKYVPEWPSEEPFTGFEEEGIGAMTSEPVRVTVEPGAPAALSGKGRVAEMVLEREGEDYVAYLLCVYDRGVAVNLRFGSGTPFAQLRWTCRVGDENLILSTGDLGKAALADFAADRLVPVGPGQRVEVGRVAASRVQAACAAAPARSGDGLLSVSYTNFFSKVWQLEQAERHADEWREMPAAVKAPLPPRVVTGYFRSEAMRIPNP